LIESFARLRVFWCIDDPTGHSALRREVRVDTHEGQKIQIIIILELSAESGMTHVGDREITPIVTFIEQTIGIPSTEIHIGSFSLEDALPFIAFLLEEDKTKTFFSLSLCLWLVVADLPDRTTGGSVRRGSVDFLCVG
jgi:hypothetical protein